MKRLQFAVLCLSALIAVRAPTFAQDSSASQMAAVSGGSTLSPEQLDQLVAPVALYPDPLLADVLTASTYPLEVIDADRWAADPQNSGLSGDDLTNALNSRGWDPSVQSLVPFPQVLQLLDTHLDWTETLGEAFLAQPGDVMDAVQRMRARAQNAGNLPSDGEETVSDQGGTIAVSPPSDLIYVPEYDPWCAFGAWPYPVGSPFYFSAWSGSCDAADYGVVFGPGTAWPFPFWSWGYFDWHRHHILIRSDKYGQFHPSRLPKSTVWQHEPQHRGAVLYRNVRNARAFGQPVAQRFPTQTRTSASAHWFHSVPPAPDGASHRIVRMPPRPAPPAGGFRAGFARSAFGAGRAHVSRPPVHP